MLRKLLRKVPGYRYAIRPLARREFWRETTESRARANFYRELIGPGDLVFDIGANMGSRSKVFLQLGARVVAFEPQQQCIDYLRMAAGRHPGFTLVTKALGEREGVAEMLIGDTNVISTLSPSWQAATRASGRFGSIGWSRTQQVEMTTLAKAIEEFGVPMFLKIDVEGYEYEVVSTLNQPIPALSVEFTAEYLENTLRCVEHFETVAAGNRYQLSMGEDAEFSLPEWVSAPGLLAALQNLSPGAWGDLYVRMALGPAAGCPPG